MPAKAVRLILNIVLAVLFLGGGAFAAKRFIEAKQGPPKSAPRRSDSS